MTRNKPKGRAKAGHSLRARGEGARGRGRRGKTAAPAGRVGGWTGRLSNSGEEVRVVDQNGGTVDSVTYADSGDWAAREHSRGVSLVENLTRDLRISGITRIGSTATVTTAGGHGLASGASV